MSLILGSNSPRRKEILGFFSIPFTQADSEKEHQVFTGVAVAHQKGCFADVEETRVFFHELTESQIRAYHACVSPLDKAGGYAIQKGGSLIVKRIEGCYYNIMGLPIHTVRRLLFNVGIDLWDYLYRT